MDEIWKEVKTHPNYEVSNLGNVKNKTTNKLMNANTNLAGYSYMTLSRNNIQKTFLVHRLVGIYFLENPENKPTINHKNKIRNDNRLENLEWATQKEQVIHMNTFQKSEKKRSHYKMKSIWRIDKDTGEKLEKYCSLHLFSLKTPIFYIVLFKYNIKINYFIF